MASHKTIILGIETSCDETASAILLKQNDRINLVSNIVASSSHIQAKYGGIIPEQAAREQVKAIIPVIKEALEQAELDPEDLDALAVTQGPGLIGSLLVGVETAKTLSLVWNKPLIPVNHLIGHFYANWIDSNPSFPCIGLLASGGHTDLVLFESHGKFKYLGGTRDDAAGECFDKCARILSLPYPGGPQISKLAQKGDPKSYSLPRPMINSRNFDFSYSGLKTAVLNLVKSMAKSELVKADELSHLCASIEQAIIDPLISKTIQAAKRFNINQIIMAGGVAANQKLRVELEKNCQLSINNYQLNIPPPYLCTDNAAMIASAAFFTDKTIDPLKLQADPNLSLAY
ncbi:tRNA (adenosine(37)-N6)-threonylcarbamoyltransferase complex transferase subunit TsaD [Candidatus Daviesbacteria bacterium]|nr:tRNA (adenosine(37)-N6)-threonylcarbamoyltransferase complex transferase subunit TsaD [Candidatus Daviesbacteria bacterium]